MDSETKKLQVALQAYVTTSYRLQAGVSSGLWSMVFGLFVQQFRRRTSSRSGVPSAKMSRREVAPDASDVCHRSSHKANSSGAKAVTHARTVTW